MEMSAHTLSLQQTLKGVESKLQFLGSGPHTTQQAEELKTLAQVKQKLIEQIQVSVKDKLPQQQKLSQASPLSTTSIVAQQPQPSTVMAAVPTVALTMQRTSLAPKIQPPTPQQIVLTKPRSPVTPYIIQAPTENDSKILNKQRLQELVKEIDPTEQLDEDVEEMLMQITDDFIESVVSASCDLAKHRKSNTLEVKDLKLHLEKQWNITIPGYGSDEVRPFKKTASTDAHKQRLALIRKATKK